ncbi:MAG: hypothetical protein CL908_01750 [Deltaproteobacteria bacterium]|nr:hypothetical protein [Deltaproteobacteria bacterium]
MAAPSVPRLPHRADGLESPLWGCTRIPGALMNLRSFVLFVIDLNTRRVETAGIRSSPNGLWTSQLARNLISREDGLLLRSRYLIHDRDPLFRDSATG